MRACLALVVLAMLAVPAAAAEGFKVEVIDLQHTTADALIPVVQPLLHPQGSVTGMNNQLVVRTTESNLAELRQVLRQLDRAPRNLRISVRQDVGATVNGREHALGGGYRAGDVEISTADGYGEHGGLVVSKEGRDGWVRYRELQTHRDTDEKNVHFINTLEGRAAFIYTGQNLPVANRTVIADGYGATVYGNVEYRDVDSGFYVLPRVSGNTVSLEINPQLESSHGARIDQRFATTTLSGRLGEWIDLGGVTAGYSDDRRVTLTQTRRRGAENYNVWVKVEEIP